MTSLAVLIHSINSLTSGLTYRHLTSPWWRHLLLEPCLDCQNLKEIQMKDFIICWSFYCNSSIEQEDIYHEVPGEGCLFAMSVDNKLLNLI